VAKPSNLQIGGVALLLFSAVLLGVGIHHLVATGTCSSTGYSASYGPVPRCPSGTGWWFGFVFGGIIGCLIGALMARGVGLVFAGIFGAIGFGALSIVLDAHTQSSTKLFAAVFGGCFALVGVIAAVAAVASALGSLRRGAGNGTVAPSGFGTPQATSAFGSPSKDADPILAAYNASRTVSPTPTASTPAPTALNLLPGLQAARNVASTAGLDELAKLSDLHQKGALTDEEFASAKAKVLGQL
jgi:Short C-terminal domain